MKNRYVEIFIGTIFLFFLVVFFLDAYEGSKYYIVRNPITFREPMVDLMPQKVDTPYSLLEGVLPLKDVQTRGNLNSQTCYEGDFQTRIEKVGSYNQMTNNYRHMDPESCSAPLTEFVSSYYKVESLE